MMLPANNFITEAAVLFNVHDINPDSKGMLAQRTKVGWRVGRWLRLGKWRWANVALADHYQCVKESWNDDFTPSLV